MEQPADIDFDRLEKEALISKGSATILPEKTPLNGMSILRR